jgi:multicomponent K+:H+ antiporter subunit C
MEVLVASAVGILTATGLYLVFCACTRFYCDFGHVVADLCGQRFLVASGRPTIGAPPILTDDATLYTDPTDVCWC